MAKKLKKFINLRNGQKVFFEEIYITGTVISVVVHRSAEPYINLTDIHIIEFICIKELRIIKYISFSDHLVFPHGGTDYAVDVVVVEDGVIVKGQFLSGGAK